MEQVTITGLRVTREVMAIMADMVASGLLEGEVLGCHFSVKPLSSVRVKTGQYSRCADGRAHDPALCPACVSLMRAAEARTDQNEGVPAECPNCSEENRKTGYVESWDGVCPDCGSYFRVCERCGASTSQRCEDGETWLCAACFSAAADYSRSEG